MTRPLAVAAAALLLAGCSGSGGGGSVLKETGRISASGAPGSQTAGLHMTDGLSFVPNVVQARVGTLALTVSNTGRVPHNLVFADPGLGHTDTVDGGATASLTLRLVKAGTFRFTCTFHHGMDGEIVVSG